MNRCWVEGAGRLGIVLKCLRLSIMGVASMKRIMTSILLVVALLTVGVVSTPYNMVGSAYAEADGGD